MNMIIHNDKAYIDTAELMKALTTYDEFYYKRLDEAREDNNLMAKHEIVGALDFAMVIRERINIEMNQHLQKLKDAVDGC